jgi:Ca-activated chloride channel homolog
MTRSPLTASLALSSLTLLALACAASHGTEHRTGTTPPTEQRGVPHAPELTLASQAADESEAAARSPGQQPMAAEGAPKAAVLDVPAAPLLGAPAAPAPVAMASPKRDQKSATVARPAAGVAKAGAAVLAPESVLQSAGSVPLLLTEHHDRYEHRQDSSFLSVATNPLSTFSIDVDTASYSNVRRFLVEGQTPPAGAVRIEEMLNYFNYTYPEPSGPHPLAVHTELTSCPWNSSHQLLRVGVKGKDPGATRQPPLNLAFLVDVSGSMNSPDKLPLLIDGLRLLTAQLRPEDRVSIVTYAGSSGLVLPPTSGADKQTIESALVRLSAGGSTNGASGINLAYTTVRQHFDSAAVNRVILATDGDFNVGVSQDSELTRLIETERKTGIFLTVLGFGRGNLNDQMMEKLADHGNGSYAYIDSLREAKRVLVEQLRGTLVPVAKDVKIQIELNPQAVAAFRLVGYENRALADRDFTNDQKDAGEMGAGQATTALYELVPSQGQAEPRLRYGDRTSASPARDRELAIVHVRYKLPTEDRSQPFSHVVTRDAYQTNLSADQSTAAAIAAFGMVLRNSPERGEASLSMARRLADAGRSSDPDGRRAELSELIGRSRAMSGPVRVQ